MSFVIGYVLVVSYILCLYKLLNQKRTKKEKDCFYIKEELLVAELHCGQCIVGARF